MSISLSTFTLYMRTFGWLVWRDLRLLKTGYTSKFIDSFILPCTFALISGYFLTRMGMPASYGSFMLVGWVVHAGIIITGWQGAAPMIMDLEGPKTINYEMTLPLPNWLVFIKYACVFTINAVALNLMIVPVGKLLLWYRFDLSQLNILKAIIAYVLVNVFCGFFALWIASCVEGMRNYGRFWLRFGMQMLLFGCSQFPWQTMFGVQPIIAYINLLNPFTYAHEGLRAAILGQEPYLNFWICIVMLVIFASLCGLRANNNFKKRLDQYCEQFLKIECRPFDCKKKDHQLKYLC